MFDPSITLFPYDLWKSVSYLEFVRWVPPPPNSLKMTDAEKVYAALRRLANPPKCNCGVSVLLTTPNQRGAFNAFDMFYQFTKYSLHFMNEYSTIPNTGTTQISLNALLNDSEELVVITPYRRPPASNTRAHLSL
jgi:hypothetical protein